MSKLVMWLIGVGIVAVLGAVFLGGPIIGFVKDRWFAAEAKAETATDATASIGAEQAADRRLTTQGAALQITVTQARQVTGQLQEAARADPQGTDPLPDDTVARLRQHDEWLCKQRPALCAGSVSPAGPATP